MNYTLKDVFDFYFEKYQHLHHITIWDKIKMWLGFGMQAASVYGKKAKIGDRVGFVMEYKYPTDKKGYMIVDAEGSATVEMILDREVDQYCEDHELMSVHEKPSTIEEEVSVGLVRTVEKGLKRKKVRKSKKATTSK
jgi:hypothetical protein